MASIRKRLNTGYPELLGQIKTMYSSHSEQLQFVNIELTEIL